MLFCITCMHTGMHACVFTYICTYINTYICTWYSYLLTSIGNWVISRVFWAYTHPIQQKWILNIKPRNIRIFERENGDGKGDFYHCKAPLESVCCKFLQFGYSKRYTWWTSDFLMVFVKSFFPNRLKFRCLVELNKSRGQNQWTPHVVGGEKILHRRSVCDASVWSPSVEGGLGPTASQKPNIKQLRYVLKIDPTWDMLA